MMYFAACLVLDNLPVARSIIVCFSNRCSSSYFSDTVVVLGNYRLGAFGWLVTDQHNGNFGLLDQRFLLQWVQKNIRNFGGDPDRVTIFGESALDARHLYRFTV
jgi:hypothetical protein